MDFVRIWGNLLAAGASANDIGSQQPRALLPTTLFMQGLQAQLACQIEATSCRSSTPSITSLTSEDTSEWLSGNARDVLEEVKGADVQHDVATPEAASIATPAMCKRRIQRIRYSREEYKCPTCPYTCTIEKAFLRHVGRCDCDASPGREAPRRSCPICGKDRNGEQMIVAHMLEHRDGKQFCCDLCAFRTLQLKKLIQHRRMHTGEKPHLCPFCVYRSARRDNLRSHVRRVHKKENLTYDTFTPRSMSLTPQADGSESKMQLKQEHFQ